MSVMDEGVIDNMGLRKNEKSLNLYIFDHLAWGLEADDVHIFMLQNKLNDYLQYIDSGQVNERYKVEDYENIIIRVIAKYPFSYDCVQFLDKAKRYINDAGFELEWEVRPMED